MTTDTMKARHAYNEHLLERPLSFSQISDYLTCRHRWYLKYVLGIRPKVRSTPLEIGDAVHRALAEFLSGGDPKTGLDSWKADIDRAQVLDDPEFNDKTQTMYETAQALIDRALVGLEDLGYWTLNDPSGKPYVETEWNIPLDAWPGGFVVKLDWIAYEPLNKRPWVCDFKTRGYFTSEDDEWSNMQNAIYQAAALLKGIDSVGTLTFQIASTPPKQPKLNKTGEMSRAAVACDWKTYRDALLVAGLDPDDYADMKARLEDKEFIRVTPIIRSNESIERVWNEIVEPVANEMREAYEAHRYSFLGAPAKTPRFLSPRTCNGCGMRPLCHGVLKGYGVTDAIAFDFNARPEIMARPEFH